MQDLRQTEEWARYLRSDGWTIVEIGRDNAFVRKFPLGLSIMKVQRFTQPLDIELLKETKKNLKTVYSIIEPGNEEAVAGLKEAGYRINKSPYLPTKTRVIDLSKSESELIAGMSNNFRRVLTKKIEVVVKKITADEFYEGWKKWSPSYIFPKGQFIKIATAFGKKCEYWAAETEGKLRSAIMLLFTDDACFYYQTWTSREGREKSPHVVLTFETMKRAKKLGKKFYNFEGIQDVRFPLSKWEGFTEFKRRFGGYEIEYPGSFTRWF